MNMRGWTTSLSIFLLLAVDRSADAFVPYHRQHRAASATVLWTADPLAKEGDWSAYLDQENTGLVYYFNGKTGESMWEPPTDTFPPVMLKKEQREAAQVQQNEYFSGKEEEQPAKKGFLSAILDKKPKKEEAKEATQKTEEEPKWFDGLFDNKEKAETPVESSANGAEASSKDEISFVDSIFGISKRKEGRTVEATGTTVQEEKIFTAPITRAINIDMSASVLPHPAKVSWGGEDAVFTNGRSFGVFDGVSGAEKLDGIPLYSVTLADEMKRLVGDGGATLTEITKKLTEAADYADRAATGASTAVVASIDEKGFLRVLNLGDSACIVIRNNVVVAKTRDIVHFFDCPYQLSEESPDRPKDGTKLNLELIVGDVIVMGSDGVFDNLSDEIILDTVKSSPDSAGVIAKRITNLSRKVSQDDKAETPYAKLAKRNRLEAFQDGVGGKVDDTSCIVVRCT